MCCGFLSSPVIWNQGTAGEFNPSPALPANISELVTGAPQPPTCYLNSPPDKASSLSWRLPPCLPFMHGRDFISSKWRLEREREKASRQERRGEKRRQRGGEKRGGVGNSRVRPKTQPFCQSDSSSTDTALPDMRTTFSSVRSQGPPRLCGSTWLSPQLFAHPPPPLEPPGEFPDSDPSLLRCQEPHGTRGQNPVSSCEPF